jgi:hypothetical protein
VKLTGEEEKRFIDEANDRADKLYAEKLRAAKANAKARGKEPFDLARLETMCDTSREGKLAPVEERIEEFEWKYYVVFSDILTLEEFAQKVDELNHW